MRGHLGRRLAHRHRIRRKIGTGSWTGLYGAGSFTVIEAEFLKAANYWDWGIGIAALNARVKPATTDQVTVELRAFVIEGTSIVSNVNVHFNRPGADGNNWFDSAERVTMLEVAQLAVDGSIGETTVTARNAQRPGYGLRRLSLRLKLSRAQRDRRSPSL